MRVHGGTDGDHPRVGALKRQPGALVPTQKHDLMPFPPSPSSITEAGSLLPPEESGVSDALLQYLSLGCHKTRESEMDVLVSKSRPDKPAEQGPASWSSRVHGARPPHLSQPHPLKLLPPRSQGASPRLEEAAASLPRTTTRGHSSPTSDKVPLWLKLLWGAGRLAHMGGAAPGGPPSSQAGRPRFGTKQALRLAPGCRGEAALCWMQG